jgi:hypothetical protein
VALDSRARPTPRRAARSGAALIIALIVLAVLDCVVLGTLHLAMLERRVAANVAAALALRLDAEAAVRSVLPRLDATIDTLALGSAPARFGGVAAPNGHATAATVERLPADLLLITGVARLPARAHGRGNATLVVHPPALPAGVHAAAAALTARGGVRFGPQGRVIAGDTAILAADPAAITGADGDAIGGLVSVLTPASDVVAHTERLLLHTRPPAGAAVRMAHDGLEVEDSFTGILIVAGDLVVRAGVHVSGLIVVGGSLVLEGGARVDGAVHVAGVAEVDGVIAADRAGVETAVYAAALREPRPPAERAWLPSFW